MAFEQKDNSGSLFKNDRKEKETHPDYKGTAMIDGKVYWISAWLKEGQKGKFFSFSFKPKDEQPSTPARREQDRQSDMGGDDIPF